MPSSVPWDKFFYWPLIPVWKIQDNIGRNINSCFIPMLYFLPTGRIKVDKMAFAINQLVVFEVTYILGATVM